MPSPFERSNNAKFPQSVIHRGLALPSFQDIATLQHNHNNHDVCFASYLLVQGTDLSGNLNDGTRCKSFGLALRRTGSRQDVPGDFPGIRSSGRPDYPNPGHCCTGACRGHSPRAADVAVAPSKTWLGRPPSWPPPPMPPKPPAHRARFRRPNPSPTRARSSPSRRPPWTHCRNPRPNRAGPTSLRNSASWRLIKRRQ